MFSIFESRLLSQVSEKRKKGEKSVENNVK